MDVSEPPNTNRRLALHQPTFSLLVASVPLPPPSLCNYLFYSLAITACHCRIFPGNAYLRYLQLRQCMQPSLQLPITNVGWFNLGLSGDQHMEDRTPFLRNPKLGQWISFSSMAPTSFLHTAEFYKKFILEDTS